MQKLSTQNDRGGVKNENSTRNWHKNGWRHLLEISYLVQISKINENKLTGILSNGGLGGVAPWLARGPPKAGLAAG